MPLTEDFSRAVKPSNLCGSDKARKRRSPPFSIRLSDEDRQQLAAEAKGVPLGTYVKSKVLKNPPLRIRREGIVVKDRQALARALALLGQSRFSSNLNQMARAVNFGVLPVTPETEEDIRAACHSVIEIRRLLMLALGTRSAAPSSVAEALEER